MFAGRALHHRVFQPRVGVVGLVVRQHRPQLPRMFVGDRHQHFAEAHPAGQLADPDLFGRGLFHADRLGSLQAAAGALDQQRAQVRIATTADFTQSCASTAGVLGGHQAEPGGHLSPVFEVLG